MGKRFTALDKYLVTSFMSVDKRFAAMDGRLLAMDVRLIALDDSIKILTTTIQNMSQNYNARIDTQKINFTGLIANAQLSQPADTVLGIACSTTKRIPATAPDTLLAFWQLQKHENRKKLLTLALLIALRIYRCKAR